jgi:ferritin
MLNQKMEEALNKQVTAELYSAYFYLAMSSYCESISLSGCANWMRAQAQEELYHGIKIYDYINERGGRAIMAAIDQPPAEWESIQDMFAAVLAHEQKVTGLINDLMNLAQDERDHASTSFLQWFIDEQVEEESSVGEVVDKLKLIGKDGNGLFVMDRELGQRVFTPPAAG